MTLRHPFTWLPVTRRPVVLALIFLATAGFAILLTIQGKPLNAPALPRAILAYEFAWTADRVVEIKDIWKSEIRTAQNQIRLDFVFLLVYPVCLSLGCAMLADYRHAAMARTGVLISWAVLFSGPLDAVENWALLRMLSHPPTDDLAQLAGVCASLKFLLVFAALGYLVLAGLAAAVTRMRSP